MSKKLDPRVLRTRRMLREALVALIIERDFDSITVRDVTERATLNHATFYLHYSNKEDLLNHMLEEMLGELADSVPAASAATMQDVHIPQEITALLFRHFAAHAAFYRVILGAKGVPAFSARLREYIAGALQARLRLLPDPALTAVVAPEFAAQFLAGAYVGVIIWWLEQPVRILPEALAEQFITTAAAGVYRAIGFAVPANVPL